MVKIKKSAVSIKNKNTNAPTTVRPPVVAVLGHVDHGKTTLLDYIRKSQVAAKEAGGITQHVGAYQIKHKGRLITFIDTPGHEAFSAMRARGGKVSDIALLVIAADDGVMPQTRESIAHIKAAKVPFIVSINKIDLPGANVEKVKKQLAEEDVLVEGYGGDVVVVQISAKTGQGIDDLLEMINLLADMQGLKGEWEKPFLGVVIEAKLDKFRGSVATILVKEGMLRVGNPIYTKTSEGKVKALIDTEGKGQREIPPSTPVEVLGFSTVPKVGEEVKNTRQESEEATSKSAKQGMAEKIARLERNDVRLIIKADVAGSLEAVTNSVENMAQGDQKLKVYLSDTGNITEGDVLLAAATKSLVIGFNVQINPAVEKLASEEKVLIRKYNVIYELLDELKEGLDALSKQEPEERTLGEAEVIGLFRTSSGKVAGCRVISGRINKNDTLVLKRGGKEMGRSKIASMKHRETEISEAKENEELGLIMEKEYPFTKGDIILAIGSSVS